MCQFRHFPFLLFIFTAWFASLAATAQSGGELGVGAQVVLPLPVDTRFRPAYIFGGGDISKVPEQGFPQDFPSLKWGWRWKAELDLTEDQLSGFQGVVASFGGATRGAALWIQDGATNMINATKGL